LVDQTKEHEPETKKYLDDLISDNKFKYVYVEYPNTSNAKNVGIKNASGDILFFFDDDVEINENTIPAHLKAYSDPSIGGTTGKVIIINTDKSGNIVLGNAPVVKNPLKTFLFIFLRKQASYVGRMGILSTFEGNKILPTDTCIGCNMSFKKEVFEKSGIFDINFTDNAVREETDLSVRIRKSGYNLVYLPDASLIHYMANTGGTRTYANEAYWHKFFKNQNYFYIKNFRFSKIHLFFLQIFDILRCKKGGCKALHVFNKGYKEALALTKEVL
jgi:GT2 family glycosyltransferase